MYIYIPGGGFGYGGDYGDLPNTAQFCINGMLGPDRGLHPSALEAAAVQVCMFIYIILSFVNLVYLLIHFLNIFVHFFYFFLFFFYFFIFLQAPVQFLLSYKNEKLNLIIQNLNLFTNLSNYSITIKLCCDVLPKGVTLPIINLKCENLKPGKNKIIELSDIFPCFKNTDLKNLMSAFGGVGKDRLAFLTEAWYDLYFFL
jgi:hypothetical protein